jgi:predicted Zn-dependent protease
MNGTLIAQRIQIALSLFTFGAALLAPQQKPQADGKPVEDAIGRAMRDELARSTQKLQLAQFDRPYFIAYRVREARGLSVSATCGSLLTVDNDDSRARILTVEVRVGDYALDNTNFLSIPAFSPGTIRPHFGFSQLPLDDNYSEIRRQIWLVTDDAYKQAIEQLAAKKAALQNRTRTEELPDLSKENPVQTVDAEPDVQLKRSDAEKLVRDLSKLLGAMPELYSSSISLSVSNSRILYLNSEGTSYENSHPLITFSASASTQAADGLKLGDSASFYARSLDRLPSRDRLAAQVREMADRLKSLRGAPPVDRYNGPVLFEGRAAAEIFGEEFAPSLAGQRKPLSGMEGMEAVFERFSQSGGTSFAGKIGARVLPDFLNVVDNPTLSAFGKEPLLGGYKVDEDGVPARETRLVEGGILKTLLTTRVPIQGVTHSTGNRRGAGAIPSNLIVEASNGPDETALKAQFRNLVKKRSLDYGIVVREVGGDSGATGEEQATALLSALSGQGRAGRGLLLAYKVYADGHEEPIRGARLSGMTAESFKDIVAASKSATVFHAARMPQFDFGSAFLFSFGAEMSQSSLPIVSYVVPSLLFEDLNLTKPSEQTPNPPFSNPLPCAQ